MENLKKHNINHIFVLWKNIYSDSDVFYVFEDVYTVKGSRSCHRDECVYNITKNIFYNYDRDAHTLIATDQYDKQYIQDRIEKIDTNDKSMFCTYLYARFFKDLWHSLYEITGCYGSETYTYFIKKEKTKLNHFVKYDDKIIKIPYSQSKIIQQRFLIEKYIESFFVPPEMYGYKNVCFSMFTIFDKIKDKNPNLTRDILIKS